MTWQAPDGDEWVGFGAESLPLPDVLAWAEQPHCGAVVLFSGAVRDHADGRDQVEWLEYEAYDEEVVPRLKAIAAEARRQWPPVGRVALLHRSGRLQVGESAVVVVVSAPHRPEAFAAARYCIDTLKATVPIWKRERWAGGEEWGTCDHPIADISEVAPA